MPPHQPAITPEIQETSEPATTSITSDIQQTSEPATTSLPSTLRRAPAASIHAQHGAVAGPPSPSRRVAAVTQLLVFFRRRTAQPPSTCSPPLMSAISTPHLRQQARIFVFVSHRIGRLKRGRATAVGEISGGGGSVGGRKIGGDGGRTTNRLLRDVVLTVQRRRRRQFFTKAGLWAEELPWQVADGRRCWFVVIELSLGSNMSRETSSGVTRDDLRATPTRCGNSIYRAPEVEGRAGGVCLRRLDEMNDFLAFERQ
ncbi:envelope glycoprotein [Striga asiatica]|uniref:Envelope glycoprotein n=1 Tax=Striga asiatica TaxID=4170 RepID=A0A5A7Q9M5_STRAF|nr:envelope glycoprotein [Striga asiatica]